MELHRLTIHEAHEKFECREISAEELTRAIFDRIKIVDKKVQAYLTLDEENALQASCSLDESGGFEDALAGIPGAISDDICTKGIRTTCGSKMLGDFIPPYDATVLSKIKSRRAILLGKTNIDEFGIGSSTEDSAFFETKNPWDLNRVPGGASGGAAASVAADECIFALGSDSGSSGRLSASYCGIVSIKPTYGRVSRYGMIAQTSSADQISPMTKDVADCALVLGAISGIDPLDPTSADIPVADYREALAEDIKGLKIGLPREYLGAAVESGVKEAILEAAGVLETLGASVEEITLPHTPYALPAHAIISCAEGSSNLALYDGIRFGYRAEDAEDLLDLYMKSRGQGFGSRAKRHIIFGTYVSEAEQYEKYYLKAQKVRALVKADFDRAFGKYDLIIGPTAPTVSPRAGEMLDLLNAFDSGLFAVPAALAGLPTLSMPCGLSKGLPVGLQIIGGAFEEASVLKLAYAYEQATDWHRQRKVL